MVLAVETEKLEVGHVGIQKDEAEGSRASTSRGDAAGKQLRGGKARARRCAAALPRRQSIPLLEHCSEPYPTILRFCKIRPNFELKTKFHQNKSYSEFYKLQNFFW